MIFSEEVVCQLCGKRYSKLGIASHILHFHGMNPEIYRRQYVYKFKKCESCGKEIIDPKRFCSLRCVNVYRLSKVKDRNPLISNRIVIEDIFNKISKSDKEEIVGYYKKGVISLLEVANKFKISEEVLKMILRHYKVKCYNSKEFQRKAVEEKKKEFIESDKGKQIIKEYQRSGGNIRSLSRKYGINRNTLKKLLILADVKLKDSKKAKNEIEKINRKKGIRGANFGKKAPIGSGKCSWYFYEGVKYQGSWEFKLGLWLKSQKISFLCHEGVRQFKYKLNGQIYTYCPDFYLLGKDSFIEVKGYLSERDKKKIEIVKNTYPEISIEIYDKLRLKKNKILDVDKILGICIEDYALNYQTNELYMGFLKEISIDELIIKNIIERQNLRYLAKQYNVPYLVMCRAFYKIVPKLGTNEFYSFCFHKFFTKDQIEVINKSDSIKGAVQQIDNGLRYKRNHEIVRRFKKGLLCH